MRPDQPRPLSFNARREGEAPAEPRARDGTSVRGETSAQQELRPPVAVAFRFFRRSYVLLVIAFLHFMMPATLPISTVRGDDDELVTQFLDRLGLTDLEIVHLERVVWEDLPKERQIALAKKLADLYASELMTNAGDEEKSLDLLQRIQRLTQRVPQADTPALQVMLLQADYYHAESLVTEWIANPAYVEARDEASVILARITPELNEFQKQLNSQVDDLVDLIDSIEESDRRSAKEKELDRTQPVAGRATYFAGWSNYYLGLTKRESAATEFKVARDIFRRVLDIDSESYVDVDAEWLGLESTWRSRALIGLGLAEAAAGNLDASRTCFQLLEHASVPPEIQDQASYWYVQGLLNAGKHGEAGTYAREKVAEWAGNATQGKVSLCVSLVRAAYGDRSEQVSSEKADLGIIGLEGLARLGERRTVRQLMDKYDIRLPSGGGFYLRWINARRLLAAAERSKTPDDYKAAVNALTAALAAPDANQHISSTGQCRYEMAWCHFQLGSYKEAGREYEQAVTGLKVSDAQTAAQSAWMAFVSFQKLSKTEPRSAADAVNALKTLKRDFPSHPHAKRADYYMKRIEQDSASPREAIDKLHEIKPGNPQYLAARYDICVLIHQLWSRASTDGKSPASRELYAAVREYLATARDDADDGRKLKCCLLAADAALNGPRPDEPEAAAFLDGASPLAQRLPPSNSLVAQYHYRRLQMAGRKGDDQARRTHADWLVQHAAGSMYEVPALVVSAKALDERLKTATDEQQKKALHREAYAVYARLVNREGNSVEALSARKNARIATSKLAYYASQLGRFDEAARHLGKLLAAYPKDKSYLRRAGLAYFHAAKYDKSLPYWRTVLSGVSKSSDEWYEAKYYQLSCLFNNDPKTGEKVLRQFKLLHPDLGPPAWKDKFEGLARRKL